MAKIVAGFGAPHSPSLPSVVAKTPDFVENGLYANLRKQIEDVQADVVIMFSNDHFNTFFLDNFPLFAIGVADETSGPNDETPMPQHKIPLHEGLASHIHRTGISSGFDLCRPRLRSAVAFHWCGSPHQTHPDLRQLLFQSAATR